jgi:uncharacterized protein
MGSSELVIEKIFQAISCQDTHEVEEIIASGFDVNYVHASDLDAFGFAVNMGYFGMAQRLIALGAKPSSKTLGVALFNAAQVGNENYVNYFASLGADVNAEFGQKTPLIVAVEKAFPPDDQKIVANLISKGANIEQKDAYGNNALLVAVFKEKQEIVNFLIQSGASIARMQDGNFLRACQNNNSKLIKELLGQDVNVNTQDLDGRTCVSYLVRNGNLESVKEIISSGADLELADSDGMTPLLTAISCSNAAIMQALLDSDANLHGIFDKTGENITDFTLNAAIISEVREAMLKMLKSKKAPEPSLKKYRKMWQQL